MTSTIRPGRVLFVAGFATFLATFNETFLNVALNPIMRDMSVNAGVVQWVTTAYMLAAAVMVPVAGFLYKKVRTSRLMALSLVLLVAGSIIGGVAPNFAILVVARVVQALGTGMIVPVGMNLTLAVAPKNKIGVYMGIIGAMTTLGPAFGPIVAGALLAHGTWHTLFFALAILSVICLVCSVLWIGDIAQLTHPHMDALSVTLAAIGLIGLLYGVSTVFSGQLVAAVVALVIGVVALVVFVLRQRRIPEPFLNLEPFGNRAFVLGVLLVIAALMTVFSMNILLPLFMESALGFTPLQAALTLLPACLVSCVLSPVAGKVFDRFGVGWLVSAGMAVIACFVLALSFTGGSTTSVRIVLLYAPAIAGCACVMGPAQSYALSSLDRRMYPHGVTIVSTTFQIAGCVGSSVFVGILSAVSAAHEASGESVAVGTAAGFDIACRVAFVVDVLGFIAALALARVEAKAKATAAAGVEASEAREQDLEHAGEPSLADAMKRDVYAVTAADSAYDALVVIVRNGTTGIPVLDEHHHAVGFVTDGDIMRTLIGDTNDKASMAYVYALWVQGDKFTQRVAGLRQTNVMEICTHRVVTVNEHATIRRVCEMFAGNRIKKLPVTGGEDGKQVVGVISRSDLMRYMVTTVAPADE
ncbi:DHA2 family efflux MFS transporter permease subunit [Bifidobacterium porcinum]|uniref:DHA2 family efflux MFS transporter permease subunit n=1 Tax=Bifidobacterium porcinum TaxID=212365 RepID=UPI0005297EC0|nr:DHA2 family efflux MFS transporter permease subunit [Bifidobacterium porcinum]